MAFGAWFAFAFRKNRLATVLTGLSFAPAVLFFLFLRIVS
jgi:hypothetical protein